MRNPNNKISVNEATLLANEVIGFLNEESATKSGNSRRIASAAALLGEKEKKVATKSTGDSPPVEMPDTLAYLFNFNDSTGFTIIAADTRVESPVLCYTGSGTLGDTIDNPGIALFLEGAENYIERSIIEAEQLRDSLIADILSKIDETGVKDTIYIDENEAATKVAATPAVPYDQVPQTTYSYGPWTVASRVGPLLSVEWGQGTPFNDLVKNKGCASGTAPAGCVAVATSYVLTYWLNKKSTPLNLDGYTINSNLLCKYTWWPRRYDGAAANDIELSNTEEGKQARSQVARLMERIGSHIGMNYSCEESGASTSNAVGFLKDLGFKYVVLPLNLIVGFDYDFDAVKSSLDKEQPVLADGYSEKITTSVLGITVSTSYKKGHAWVMDGYLRRSRQVTVTVTTTTTGTVPVTKVPSNDKLMLITTTTTSTYTEYSPYYLHNNWGWYGTDNGYYVAGSFDTNKGPDLPSNTKSGVPYNYQFNIGIYPYIYY